MSTGFEVKVIATTPFAGQKPGTSGLRKKVVEVQQPHYLENFVQAIFDAIPTPSTQSNGRQGETLVLGGDGRYYNDKAIATIIKMAAANGFGKVLVAQDGIFATPAVSATVRARKALGAIILTASHNPGGPDADFGIKYNMSNGGPAPENVTNAIFMATTTITHYKIADFTPPPLSDLGEFRFGTFTVEVIDPKTDYVALLQEIFDFPALKEFISRKNFKARFDSLNGVTGPFSRHIFHDLLGAPLSSCLRSQPLPDFGNLHPDPNLTYAADLVSLLENEEEKIDFGCAWDGDGDRNMILGHKFFVTPSDSVAIIAAHSQSIPYFAKNGLQAVSRSMPTSEALDRVASSLQIPLIEVPTGWKFFGNLMDEQEKKRKPGFLCGEESFGTGSDHIREKDGIWATLAWLSILASSNKDLPPHSSSLISVREIVEDHWRKYGRNYYCRYDYEAVSSEAANEMMAALTKLITTLTPGSSLGPFTLTKADDFSYEDPVDKTLSKHQGIRFLFSDGSRFVIRLSGTGSVGATIRIYMEKYEKEEIFKDVKSALSPLIGVALETIQIKKFIGTEEPTVIT